MVVGADEMKIIDLHFIEHARNSDETEGFGCFGIRSPFTAQTRIRKGDLPFFMSFFVYILYSERLDRYYTGQTNDLVSRLKRHNHGSEQYTAKGIPWRIVYFQKSETRANAMKLERKIKNFKSVHRILEFIEKELAEGRGCRGDENH